jgi:hypothetical protein
MIAIETISYAQALKLVNQFPAQIQAEVKDILDHLNATYELISSVPEIGVIRGDVNGDVFELPGSFDIVFILGNAKIKTFIRDTGPSDYSLLAISGNVAADALISLCSMVVGGTIKARCVYASSSNHGQLLVGGNIVATQLFFEEGQFTQCKGSLEAPLIISTHNEIHAQAGIHGKYFKHSEDDFLHYFLDEFIESSPEMLFNGSTWAKTGNINHGIATDALVAALHGSKPVLK